MSKNASERKSLDLNNKNDENIYNQINQIQNRQVQTKLKRFVVHLFEVIIVMMHANNFLRHSRNETSVSCYKSDQNKDQYEKRKYISVSQLTPTQTVAYSSFEIEFSNEKKAISALNEFLTQAPETSVCPRKQVIRADYRLSFFK